MNTKFRVAPVWREDDLSTSPIIVADYAHEAAAEYVRLNMANLDYPDEVEILTLQYHDGEAAVRLFEVVKVPAYEAREIVAER